MVTESAALAAATGLVATVGFAILLYGVPLRARWHRSA